MIKGRTSVLIAAYNARYLRGALESVAKQTYRNISIIVRDDNRTEAVCDVINAFKAQRGLPIDYERNAEQLGVRRNYERCFADADGEYIKFLNDDDLLDPPCIERLVAALEHNPSAHLATSHRRRIDDRGSPLRDIPATQPVVRSDSLIDGTSLVNALLLLGLNFVGEPSTALFRRSAIRPDEPLFEFLGDPGRGVADFVVWCKLAQRGDVAFLASRLSSFRMHDEQRQNLLEVRSMGINSIQSMRDKWLELGHHLDIPPNILRIKPLQTATRGDRDAQLISNASWQFLPIPAFTPPASDAQQLVNDWRAKRHPFFTSGTDIQSAT